MDKQVLKFQEMLVQVQDKLSQSEVLDLVFLCSEILKKDLSNVVTATNLFFMLQNHNLLDSNDSSLLVELLGIIKRDNLIRDMKLTAQLPSSRISPYRQMLFKFSENISKDDLDKIKFLLSKFLPQKMQEKEVTILQLFLKMEHGSLLAADNLDILKEVTQTVNPSLEKIINLYEMEVKDKPGLQETSVNTRPIQETVCATNQQELLFPSNFTQPQSTETQSLGTLVSGMTLQTLSAHMTPSEEQNLTPVDETSRFSEQNQNKPQLAQYSTQYHMSGDRRGFALIINNHDFSKSCLHLRNRHGTDKDEEILVSVFKWLGFETLVRQDCKKADILRAVDELRELNHSEADCVVCCVLSHGFEGGVYGVDGEKVLIKDLLAGIGKCQSLLRKPKLFFIQACQGQQEQQVVTLDSDGPNNTTEMGIFSHSEQLTESIPASADYLVAMATVPGCVSFREKSSGSWFIQTLCEKLQQLVPSGTDLLYILTEVNNDVSMKVDKYKNRKQMPQPQFTLTKKVVFPIPKTPKPS